jgi:DNA-binding transcriptional regulator LsrR (DeoR family)
MRAHRRAAIAAALRERGVATDREVAEALGLGRRVVQTERALMVADGLVEAVPSPPGSHYPTAGWRVCALETP